MRTAISNIKNKLVGILLVLIGLELAFAQNGYKNFQWGEGIENVKHKTGELSEPDLGSGRFYGLYAAYAYENSDLYQGTFVPNPKGQLEGKLLALEEREVDRTFYFLESRLVAVELTFFEERIADELQNKYGRAPSTYMTGWTGESEIKAWFKEPNRIITYRRISGLSFEFVTYIDEKVYNQVTEKLKNERIKEIQKVKSRLD